MHRTETIDYVIVIAGEIDMDMDDSTVHLRAGDVMVQRGTNHAWVNRSAAPARVALVLIDAVPLGIGHRVTGSAGRDEPAAAFAPCETCWRRIFSGTFERMNTIS
jgi:hypothetical protein